MNDIAIFGAGGLGREVALMIRQINALRPTWRLVGFFDDGKQQGDMVDGIPVLGGMDKLNGMSTPLGLVIAIANSGIRKKIGGGVTNSRVSFPTLIHSSAEIGDEDRNRFGQGCIVAAGCILTTNVQLGEFVILNLKCTVGHDVSIGNYSSVMPGCNISGFVKIEDHSYLGTGAIILPHIVLGRGCTVGAGAVVTRSVESGSTVVGIPASRVS